MQIELAFIHEQGIDFVVFNADARIHTRQARQELLDDLTRRARAQNWNVDKSALAFMEHGRLTFFGTPDLVRFLSASGLPRWTHVLPV